MSEDELPETWSAFPPKWAHELPFQRPYAVRVKPTVNQPGVYGVDTPKFADAIANYVDQADVGQLLECLSYTSDERVETVVSSLPSNVENVGQIELGRFKGDETTDSIPPGQEASRQLGQQLAGDLDGTVDIERSQITFSPVGGVPVATCRLALPKSANPTPVQNLGLRPVVDMFNWLRDAGVPFIYQVLIQKTGSDDFVASVRLCVVDNYFAVASNDGFYRLYDNGHPYDLERSFGPANFETNFNSTIDDYYTHISPKTKSLYNDSYVSTSQSTTALDVYTGSNEYMRLFRGTLNYHDIYKDQVGYPKFPIERDALPHFIALPQILYDETPWDAVNSRQAPQRTEINGPIRDNSWSQTANIESHQTHRQHRSGSSATAGSDTHETNLRAAIKYLEQRGYTLVRVQQDGESVPDAIGVDPDGERVWLEYENPNGKPENYLKNIARAIVAGIKPIMLIGDSDTSGSESEDLTEVAERFYENLYQPFRETNRLGTWLFNRGQNIVLDDGKTVVLPKNANRTKWYVTCEDDEWRLICQANGETIAEGPAEESVTDFEYDCPRYHKDNGKHIIEAADGTELLREQMKSQALSEWTLASKPHLPVRLSYAGVTKLLIQGWNGLNEPDVSPSWTTMTETMERYRQSVDDILETFLVDMSGNDLRSKTVHKHYEFIADEMTELKVPGHRKFGEARDEDKYPHKDLGADGEDGKGLKDVQWAVPPTIVSPDIPTLDEFGLDTERQKLKDQTSMDLTESDHISPSPTGSNHLADEADDGGGNETSETDEASETEADTDTQ